MFYSVPISTDFPSFACAQMHDKEEVSDMNSSPDIIKLLNMLTLNILS